MYRIDHLSYIVNLINNILYYTNYYSYDHYLEELFVYVPVVMKTITTAEQREIKGKRLNEINILESKNF